MPVKPQPSTYECPACGWSKTVAPKSDCLAEGYDYFTTCPKCGSENLESRPANAIERFLCEVFGCGESIR
jgi:peptide subunit release factor 1 (eRF1)